MDKYINVAEIAFAFKEEEVAAQYGGKNDISTGVLFALDTLELDMPESIVRCKDCKHYENHKLKVYENCVRNERYIPMLPNDFCSYGERRSDG